MLKTYPGAAGAADVEDFDEVVSDPAAFYETPEAVVDDGALNRAQRLRLLGEWAQDLIDRQVAENEGMAPETPAAGAADAQLLRRVNAAIEVVEASPEAPGNLLTRVWRRLVAI